MPDRPGHPDYFSVDFNQTPYVVAWETTRACALSCQHCRAMAIPRRDPRELTTDEGKRLIDGLVELGRPILILTGGDPFMRRDLEGLAAYATEQGLSVGISPSATKLVTEKRLRSMREAGARMIHVSIDALEAKHDGFRGVPGSFARTIEIIRDAKALGYPIQIGTTVTRGTVGDLPGVAALLLEQGITVWNVFFLVPTGRGQREDMLNAAETEAVLTWLWQLSKRAPFRVRTTAAQHYRRVVIQQERMLRGLPPDQPSESVRWEATGLGYAFREGGQAPQQQGVNDGKGFAFVSHLGDVYPSGFLQASAGNVRETSIVELYRQHELFTSLRDSTQLLGKCGRCAYRDVCSGSRARAWALTGNPLTSDPTCLYQPGQPLPELPPLEAVFDGGAGLAAALVQTPQPAEAGAR
ncbi:MAG: TIGR04053 family radical SAM/SPASM domain-containing protein [Chloroflexi bacterium]|nr:TIGR04053 family radical SAM/SPASM domain-containing protein [Chloroflexota bacterium]